MRFVLKGLILTAALAIFLAPAPLRAQGARTVVELFTSQGCSSCPPADSLLAELAHRKDVIALSYHVDYWNYIGWKDPFSHPANTARQRAYRRILNRSYIYTPQIVVDGRSQAVGSDRRTVTSLIRRARRNRKLEVRLSHNKKNATRIRIAASRHRGPPATIWVAFYDTVHTTRIKSGENRGHTLTNANVVRSFQRVGSWRGARLDLEMDDRKLGAAGRDGCAVLVQESGSGRVIGAASIPLPKTQ